MTETEAGTRATRAVTARNFIFDWLSVSVFRVHQITMIDIIKRQLKTNITSA